MSGQDSTLELCEKFMAANAAEEALAASGQHPADRVADALFGRLSDAKRYSTLQARAALAGIALQRIDGDFGKLVYVATVGAVTTRMDSLDEVEAWISRATGALEKH